ncbi:MAG: prepilin-type N-terminal cleavage/methylation domain-containing protein [Proteobacteria bacterium]|nr:prepilin-type N-terminal cleavage/methylation domain-containing protein [Pseudomonadota bacterium]MBU2623628.1 prepilin-type N-terminal cleavage/methylation domain-containing protein [Pseudomonadota bacterium]
MMEIKKIMRYRCRNDKGFTLIEVIAVLVIVAIVSAVVISRGMDTDAVNLQVEIDTLKGHLRYAQYLALNDISPVKWGIDVGGSSYELVKYSITTKQSHTFILPGDSSATHNFANGITGPSTLINVLFDEWGSPYNASAKVAAAWTITLTQGSQSKSMEIKPETGFIP